MLHRMALRVLPSLTMAVTDEPVRKRKRLVMLVAGLAAFVLYRVVKHLDPLTEPLALLGLSGLVSAATAVWAYRVGRNASLRTVWNEDGVRMVSWLVGWIGFAYGVQLSLMVLSLLKLAQYDFFRHPDGPAVMAIIIACLSVARDAFEIGHIRRLQRQGDPVLTFPDGAALRVLFREQPGSLVRWAVLAAAGGAALAIGVGRLGEAGRTELGQLVAVGLFAGTVAVWAYLVGEQRLHPPTPGAISPTRPEPAKTGSFPAGRAHSRAGGWRARLSAVGWPELFRFWWWPGLAFAATYYLVLAGGSYYVLRINVMSGFAQGVIAGAVAGMMALSCSYLGYRRCVEDRVQQRVPTSLLRCPFVLGMLSKSRSRSGAMPSDGVIPSAEIVLGESGRRG